MELYTIALSQWRKAKERQIELFDITVKSGFKLFAPQDDVLWAYKRGEVTDDQYTVLYLERLGAHFRSHPEAFQEFLEREGKIAVACYCRAGKFCHRHLFVDYILQLAEDNGYAVKVCGEIL
ncbi:hypothetical protein D3C76_25400 [compost metagenome]